MVIHTQVDWRSPQDALAWDLSLVRSVFWCIHKRYDEEYRTRRTRLRHGENQHESIKNDHFTTDTPSDSSLDEHRLVAKADVLIGLKTTEFYLDKRPFLRALYTSLACCSNEREMESVSSYVKSRVRERSISYVTVAAKLREIYKKHIDLLAFEAKLQEFKAAARAKSTWCVRDYKSICQRPSQFYGVHNIPPKPKTAKQIEMELQLIHSHARAVAINAITMVVAKLVDATRPQSRRQSARTGRRSSATRHGIDAPTSPVQTRAKQKREQQATEERRKALRLQLFIPGITRTREASDFGAVGNDSTTSNQYSKQRELLALVESNGDVAIAQQLLQQTIPGSGFSRVAEHLANLHAPTHQPNTSEGASSAPDAWEVIKLWRSVYRNRTVQAIQRLEQ